MKLVQATAANRILAIYAYSAIENSEAIAQQIREGQQYARRMRLASPAVFFDSGKFGTRPRPGRNAIIRAAEAKSINVIVTRDFSRISRDPAEVIDFCGRVQACGAELHVFETPGELAFPD